MVAQPSATILLVEDDPFALDALAQLLLAAGYEVASACNGWEALRMVRQSAPPSLIILDLLLPGLDGWSFCETLRSDSRTQNIPVIVCSGAPLKVQLSSSSAVTAQAFHPKPIDPDNLLATIRELCNGDGLGH